MILLDYVVFIFQSNEFKSKLFQSVEIEQGHWAKV